jgi:hypothetical protein
MAVLLEGKLETVQKNVWTEKLRPSCWPKYDIKTHHVVLLIQRKDRCEVPCCMAVTTKAEGEI